MASSSTTPVTGPSSKPPSPPSSPTTRASEITGIAKDKIFAPSSSAPPLSGQPVQFDWNTKYNEADRLIKAGDKQGARVILSEIFDKAKAVQFSAHDPYIVKCEIGMAASFDLGTDERTAWVQQAKNELDKILMNESNWRLSKPVAIHNHQTLRFLLQQLKALVPQEETAVLNHIDEKIIKCQEQIPIMFDFNLYLYHADIFIKEGAQPRAAIYFQQALELIKGKTEIEFRFARVDCYLKLAASYPVTHLDRELRIILAKNEIYDLYEMRETLYKDAEFRDRVLDLLTDFLDRLGKLNPNEEILEKKEVLQREKTKPLSAPSALKSSTETRTFERLPHESPRLTSPQRSEDESEVPFDPKEFPTPRTGSEGSGRFIRLFALFALTVLAISAVAFYRRNIVKID